MKKKKFTVGLNKVSAGKTVNTIINIAGVKDPLKRELNEMRRK